MSLPTLRILRPIPSHENRPIQWDPIPLSTSAFSGRYHKILKNCFFNILLSTCEASSQSFGNFRIKFCHIVGVEDRFVLNNARRDREAPRHKILEKSEIFEKSRDFSSFQQKRTESFYPLKSVTGSLPVVRSRFLSRYNYQYSNFGRDS